LISCQRIDSTLNVLIQSIDNLTLNVLINDMKTKSSQKRITEKRRMISLRLPHRTIEQIDKIAKANKSNKTAVMVEAVDSMARGG